MSALVYSSVTFSAVAHYAYSCQLVTYALLWSIICFTSIFVHSEYYDETNFFHETILLLDKSLCYCIALYGGYLLIRYSQCKPCTWAIPVLAFVAAMYLWYRRCCACTSKCSKEQVRMHLMFHTICIIGHASIIYAVGKKVLTF